MSEDAVGWGIDNYIAGSSVSIKLMQIIAPNAREIFYADEGGNNLVNRSITDSFNGSSLEKGVAIQSDNVVQCFGGKQEDFEKIFSKLKTEIEHVKDKDSREQAAYLAEDLMESYKNNNETKTKKVFGLLTNILGFAGSMASLASLFGIVIKV